MHESDSFQAYQETYQTVPTERPIVINSAAALWEQHSLVSLEQMNAHF